MLTHIIYLFLGIIIIVLLMSLALRFNRKQEEDIF